jgi:hypothetical protein
MSVETWLEKTLADRPPLTAGQVAALRPILAPVVPHMNAAPVAATTEATPAMPAPQEPQEKGTM